MSLDPRLILARDGLADVRLQGVAPAAAYAPSRPARCRLPAAGVRAAPSPTAEQPDQLLFGEGFDVLDSRDGWSFGQARRDGYVGYVQDATLEDGAREATHWVSALRAYAFSQPDLKAPARGLYGMNALVRIEAVEGRFAHDPEAGWFVADQLRPLGEVETDLAAVAERFVGAPYLWGGRDSLGLDCSGLVQQALYACGRACPRDTDMQLAVLGRPAPREALARGDLAFWAGHVAVMLDGERMVHASGDLAAVVVEPLSQAAERIAALGRGAPVGFRRL